MGKRDDQRKIKLCILNKIKEHKSVLFGRFSSVIDRHRKASKWQEMAQYAISLGAIDASRDPSYLRDVWWPNVRKATMEKVDNAKKTGTGGGPDKILTPVDDEVLDILGSDCPSITGLDVPESMSDEANEEISIGLDPSMSFPTPEFSTLIPLVPGTSIPPVPGTSWALPSSSFVNPSRPGTSAPDQTLPRTTSSNPTAIPTHTITSDPSPIQPEPINNNPCPAPSRNRGPSTGRFAVDREMKHYKKECLKIQLYKLQLEARKLEVELGMEPSEFTSHLKTHVVNYVYK